MPSVSRSQQRFMAMVMKAKQTGKAASSAVAKAAKSMTEKQAEDFASTKRKGLPEHKITAIKKRKGRIK